MVVNETDSLKGLVELALRRHDTSARQLAFKAQEGGHKITYTTLNHIRNNTYRSIPGAVTLKAIAWLAGVDESVAFTAAGQPVPGPPLADELPPGADHLSPKSRKAVVEMVRVLVDLEAGNNAERPTTQDSPTTNLRAVAPTSDTSQGQKTEPEGSIIEFHGAEAEKYPAPPIESLAAHPKVKTVRERLDEESGERDD